MIKNTFNLRNVTNKILFKISDIIKKKLELIFDSITIKHKTKLSGNAKPLFN